MRDTHGKQESNYTRPRVAKTPTARSGEPTVRSAAEGPREEVGGQPAGDEISYELANANYTGESETLKGPNKAAAVGKVVAGAALGAAGVAMLVLPGPGIAGIAAGAFLAFKGVQDLTGKENPVIMQVEQHPEYQAAVQTAKDAAGTVKVAVNDAAKQVPDAVAGAGKAMLEAVDSNLPPSVKEAVDTVAPVVKNAADVVGPMAKSAADAVAPVVKNAAEAAAPVVKAAGEELNAGMKQLAAAARERLAR